MDGGTTRSSSCLTGRQRVRRIRAVGVTEPRRFYDADESARQPARQPDPTGTSSGGADLPSEISTAVARLLRAVHFAVLVTH